MPPIPAEQTSKDALRVHGHTATKHSPHTPPRPAAIHAQQGDRGSGDNDAVDAKLPVYCRYRDLVAAGICTNWPQLLRMIDEQDFPPGILLSANIRVFEVEKVRHFLATRPTARKVVPPPRKPRRRTNRVEAAP